MRPVSRIFRAMVVFGLIGFLPGFFGPMLLAPGANQGPLLGILITGPIGVIVGLGVGLWREWRRARGQGSPGASTGPGEFPNLAEMARHPLARGIAALVALILLGHGIAGLKQGAGRGAGAALVLALVLGWFAATAKVPGWARRR